MQMMEHAPPHEGRAQASTVATVLDNASGLVPPVARGLSDAVVGVQADDGTVPKL